MLLAVRLRPPRISSHSYRRLRLSKANLCLQDWFYSNGHSEFDLRHLLRIDYPDLHRLGSQWNRALATQSQNRVRTRANVLTA